MLAECKFILNIMVNDFAYNAIVHSVSVMTAVSAESLFH